MTFFSISDIGEANNSFFFIIYFSFFLFFLFFYYFFNIFIEQIILNKNIVTATIGLVERSLKLSAV